MAESEKSEKKTEPVNPVREYAIIRLPKKSKGSTEPDQVPIRVNGERILLQRNEFIPIHKKHILAARNALEPVFEEGEQLEGAVHIIRRRKVTNFAPRFPFELAGWISEKDYQKFRNIALKRSITQKEVDAVIYGG